MRKTYYLVMILIKKKPNYLMVKSKVLWVRVSGPKEGSIWTNMLNFIKKVPYTFTDVKYKKEA